jgi:queuosine precursor transporter
MPVLFACLIYVAAIVGANLSIAAFGPWVSPINSFLLIGLDLTMRDRLHDAWGGKHLWSKMIGLIVIAGVVSYIVNPAAGQIAIASAVAFIVAGLVDAGTYHWLRSRAKTSGYMVRVNGSNAAGALADSILFPTLAFGVFMPVIIAMQFAAKVGGGYVWSVILRRLAIESR